MCQVKLGATLATLLCLPLVASAIATRDVPLFAERWSAKGERLGLARGRRVAKVVRHEIGGTAPVFHETQFEGGGFAVVDPSADEIIAFSDAGELNACEDNPLWILLKRHMMLRAAGVDAKPLRQTSASAVSDLRVAPLLKTRWNQQQTAGGLKCWNYYTPNGYPCGCVATAMAQVMRYHEWPERPLKVETNPCAVEVGGRLVTSNLTMKGGPYDWQGMPYVPGNGGITESNREAIGRLTYDCGVAMHMEYASGGSGAPMEPIHLQLKDVFGYASALTLNASVGESLDDTSVRNAILANLDACCPVLLGIFNYDPENYSGNDAYREGHCVVADGYGFIDGEAYVHLNFGWTGNSIAWYKLPDIGTSSGYNLVDSVAYNVFPEKTGEIVSGHVTDHGTNAAGVVVCAYRSNGALQDTATTDTNGVYALIVPSSTAYSLEATLYGETKKVPVRTGHSASYVEFDWTEWTVSFGFEGVSCGNAWGNDIEFSSAVRDPRLFVSAATGSDVTGTGEASSPVATIGAALAKAVAGDTIFVGPGVYTGAVEAVAATVTIVSTDGPEETVIDAAGQSACYYGNANQMSVLSGFTLQNGIEMYGGGVCGGTVSNCVIRYCYAYSGSRGDGGYGGGAYGAALYDTYLYGNEADVCGGGASACSLTRCTVYSNWAGGAGGGADVDSACTDSIVWNNWNYEGALDNWETYVHWGQTYRTAFNHSCTYPSASGTGNLAEDPLFAGEQEADLRLRVNSPCVGTATAGRNMGAYQGAGVAGSRITVEIDGPGWVTPMSALLSPGEAATFEATVDHPFVGYETNGVGVATAVRVTLPCPDDDLTLTARFANTNFCVDAATGDDANDGWSWATAKRTIQAAADVLADGERIDVRPGVYDGFVSYAWGSEVVATEGPATTVLDARGEGRCFADGGATTVRGFSLVNAAASGYYGGGAYGGRLIGCVISNCVAGAGGGAAQAVLENCVLVGNRAEAQGGGAYNCLVDRCTVVGNRAEATRSASSEFAGGGVDYLCDCTNSVIWGNVNAAGEVDNWEAYAVRTRSGTSVSVPQSMEHCCTEPWISIGSDNVFRNPRLVDPLAGDIRLYESSPCLGAATDGGNIGAYAGPGVRIELPVLPSEPTAQDVVAAVAAVGYADPQVATYIGGDAERYTNFRNWAAVQLGQPTAVVFAEKAYLSYALRDLVASPTLLADETQTRLEIPSLSVDGVACTLTVRLKDGDATVPLAAVKEAFAAKLRLGVTPSGLAPATADDIRAAAPQADGTVTLSVRAPSATAGFYDLKIH